MKKILLMAAVAFVLLLSSVPAFADGESNTITIKFAGVPSGACSFIMIGMNGSNGNIYTCPSGTWVLAGGGGGGSGTVSSCGPGNAVYTANGTTVTCDPLITDTTLNGTLTFAQGTITTSQPWLSHTVTWNAGGVVFQNFVTNIATCTAAAAGSTLFDFQRSGTSQFVWKAASTNCNNPRIEIPDGSSTFASFGFGSDTAGHGWFKNAADDWCIGDATNCKFRFKNTTGLEIASANAYGWSSTANAALAYDTCMDRQGAGVVRVDANSACNDGLGSAQAQKYTTTANCAGVGTAANPSVASCAGATAGSFSCATNASGGTCVVNTTAVATTSEIFIHQRSDTVTGTRLGVTCNATISTTVEDVTAVTAGTSFTINLGTITTNPECFSFLIVN